MIPLGILDGAMGALPSDSHPYYCNKNSTAARELVEPMFEYLSQEDYDNTVTHLTNLLGYTYNTTWSCYYGVTLSISDEFWLNLVG